MKRTLLYLTAPIVVGVATLLAISAYTLPATTVNLPIEVLGSDGHTASVAVNVPDASGVDRIWFLGYSVAHPKHFRETMSGRYNEPKAEVRLNGGPWVGITNRNVTCNEPEASAFECVEGPYPTTRFAISTDQLGAPVSGQNTVEFRFNYTDADLSSGYYILGMAFLRAGDPMPSYTTWKQTGAIAGTTWQKADPGRWAPPEGYNNGSDIAAGEQLWNQRNLLADYPGGPPITASCADCHAQEGEDLEAFSFSNKSIEVRAQFHELSAEQGKQIAAYIRSQSHPRVSWPWQPPYQPGPEISSPDPDCDGFHPDEAPQKCWTAGAGLEGVLDKDVAIADYMFPNGVAGQQGLEVAATGETLNVREIPIAFMYPDWNDWLPRVHPLDSDAFGDAFRSSTSWSTYENGSLHAAKSDPQSLHQAVSNWYQDRYVFGGEAIQKYEDPIDEKMGFKQWSLVKLWEVMRGVEDVAPQVYESGEARSWLGPDSTPFDVAPHIHQGRVYGPERSAYDTYLDTGWYDLAMVLNAGNRRVEHVLFPIDWRYHMGHLKSIGRATGRQEPLRFARAYIKQNQVLDTGDDAGGLRDWFWRYTTHFQMFDPIGPENDKTPMAYAPEPLKTHLYTTLFRAYMQRVLRVPTDAWPRGYGEHQLEPEGHVPNASQNVTGVTDYAEHFYRGLPWLRDRGVRASLIDSAATWAATMWPRGNDPSVMGNNPTWDEINPCVGANIPSDCSGSSLRVSLTDPTPQTGFTAPATIELRASVDASEGVDRVRFLQGTTEVADDATAPYTFSWTGVEAGVYTLTAEAIDSKGSVATASPVTIVVAAPGTATNGVRYDYYEGNWQRLPDLGAQPSVATGTVSTFTLDPRQRDERFAMRYITYIKIPSDETGTYTFYTTSDDGSRLLVDGVPVVKNDGIHAPQERSGTVDLSSGWHQIIVEYFEQSGGESLSVSWASSAVAKTEIPPERLFLVPLRAGTQSIALKSGWNIISSYINPDNLSVDQLFAGTQDLVMVKDEVGNAYIPSLGVDDIGTWQPSNGYQVYVGVAQTLTLQGTALEPGTTIDLEAGWNLVAFYPRMPMDVSTAFSTIANQVVMVKDEVGNAYIPSLGVNDIGTLEPGNGYQVYVQEAVSFAYPSQETAAATPDAP